ncbi:hypothetical protein BBJ28_00012630 [Nothophytophthora sp. Chile5]|nr:hypothetical protein BBJ28_00012630 [Nothophytophthora sp. Chile5]
MCVYAGSFPNPNAQQRQRPTNFQSSPGFNYAAPRGDAAPQFHSQPIAPPQQRAAQRGPAHQFFQKPVASSPAQGSQDGFFSPQPTPAFSQDFQQAGGAVPAPQQQFQAAPGFQHRHPAHANAGNNFAAQDFLHKQSELYLPGAYGIWGSLKYYFTVNNSYVKSRLKVTSQFAIDHRQQS